MADDLRAAYRTVIDDHFPAHMIINFTDRLTADHRLGGGQRLVYSRVDWVIGDEKKGLRYGENPGQEAVLYKLVNGNLVLGEVEFIQPRNWLVADLDLRQSGKHPGKTNLTDVDNCLNIMRYLDDRPTAVVVKHNNPCGVAQDGELVKAFEEAYMVDRLAAMGGAVALNMPVDKATAERIAKRYVEVVAAPGYEDGALEILGKRKDLRVVEIKNMERLKEFKGTRFPEFKSLIDGSNVIQFSYVPADPSTWRVPEGVRQPTPEEMGDLTFGWMVEAGITSNSVIYVKDRRTVGIGTGEQDRVGVAESARDKAYRKLADRICWEKHGVQYNKLLREAGLRQVLPGTFHPKDVKTIRDQEAFEKLLEINGEVQAMNGGLEGARMVSDAFFPFRDGIDVGLTEGVTAVVHPGGSNRDKDSEEACIENDAAMIYTGLRSFKH